MIDALTTFINGAGLFAPLYYIASFVLTALVPVVPTPLVAALGGTAFGYGPAAVYGVMGLGLGAFVSLALARSVGRPLLRRLMRKEVWDNWEGLLGIRSPLVWGLIFLVTNLDFLVAIAGLSQIPLSRLWITAVLARTPWLLVSVWLGDVVLVNDGVALLTALLLIPGVYAFNRLQPLLRSWLLRLAPAAGDVTPSEVESPARSSFRPTAPVAVPAGVEADSGTAAAAAKIGRSGRSPSVNTQEGRAEDGSAEAAAT